MKILKKVLTLLFLSMCISLYAQTNTFQNNLKLLPTPVIISSQPISFQNEKLSLRLGTVYTGINSSAFASQVAGTYYLTRYFGVGGEVINGAVNGIIEGAHLTFGLKKSYTSYSFEAFAGGGYDIVDHTWDNIAGLRFSYTPTIVNSMVFSFVETRATFKGISITQPTGSLILGIGIHLN